MEEPTNYTSTAPQAPTIQEAYGAYVPAKYDFQHIFDRDEFEGRVDMVWNKDGTPMTKICVCKKVALNSKFIEVHNLTSCSHPADFIVFLLPLNGNPYSTAKNPLPTFQLLAKWTNLKATLADDGPNGSC